MAGPIPRDQWTGPLPPPTQPGPEIHESLQTVRLIGRLMDNAVEIPGTKFRVGLDALIGLIPVVGDVVAFAVSSYILMTAAKLGVPRVVLARMLANVGIDAAVGAVPFVGDLFDVAWRANAKNAALLEQSLAEPQRARRSSTWVLVALVLAVFLLIFGGLALAVALGILISRQLG